MGTTTTELQKDIEGKLFTVEEYLAFEEKSLEKHEYHNGKLIPVNQTPMAGASLYHVKIATKLLFQLMLFMAQSGKKNEILGSDIKIWLDKKEKFVYPDVVIMENPVAFYEDNKNIVTNPLLIIEVLSDSTEAYDRGEKFNNYSTLESLREYVLVAQKEPKIDVFYRTEFGNDIWQIKSFKGINEICTLQSIDAEIKLADVYEGIDFEEKGNTSEK